VRRRGNVIAPIDTISTLVEMLIQTDSSVEDGETVWVRSVQKMYVYRVDSGLVPNGTTIVASLYGNGVWQQIVSGGGGDAILVQPNWYLNAITGDDANDGATPLTPIQTNAELAVRWGTGVRLANQIYLVEWQTPMPSADPAFIDAIVGPNALLILSMDSEQHLAGTLTGYDPTDRPTQTMNQMVDTGVASFVPFLGQIVQFTSGPAQFGFARILAEPAANTARLTTPVFTDGAGGVTRTPDPGIGDEYVIQGIPTMTVGMINIRGAGISVPGTSFVSMLTMSLDGLGAGSSGGITIRGVQVQAERSSFRRLDMDIDQFLPAACLFNDVQMEGRGIARHVAAGDGATSSLLRACAATGQMRFASGSAGTLDMDFVFQNAGGKFDSGSGWGVGTVAWFDGISGQLTSCFVDAGATLVSAPCPDGDNDDLIWGTNNVGNGVYVKSNGGLLYVTKPTVNGGLGVGREVSVGGNNKEWIPDIPFNDSGPAASGAIVAEYA
jgi:hypothetical protein